jgi:hypothetical protein
LTFLEHFWQSKSSTSFVKFLFIFIIIQPYLLSYSENKKPLNSVKELSGGGIAREQCRRIWSRALS